MKKYLIALLLLCFACETSQKFLPAEDALDAAREFKNACLKGDFAKAKFYVVANKKNEIAVEKIKNNFTKNIDDKGRKESKEASLIVIANNEISKDTFQIIISNSFDKLTDTFNVTNQNGLWLLDL